jgi:Leucine-rich repeat (LRR) protein
MTQLGWLWLDHNQIIDISALSSLTNLIFLDLSYNQIIDINALSSLTEFQDLDITSNCIVDFTPVSHLDVRFVTGASTAEQDSFCLDDDNDGVPDFQDTCPATLAGTIVDATGCPFVVAFPDATLEACVRTEVAIPSGNITTEDLASLVSLACDDVLNLEGMQYISNLYDFALVSPELSDISQLSSLTNLSFLVLQFSQISDISPLSGLINLTFLDLMGNQISDISPLSGLTSLELLSLGDNQISDISPLNILTNLTDLGIDLNCITDFSHVSHVPNVWGGDFASQHDGDNDGILQCFDVCPAQGDQGAGIDPSGCPNPDADGDGIADASDAFPTDPAASIDTDGDGSPDSWNPGKTQGDSTTGLTLDAYPTDPSENTDSDGDGLGDNADAFPNDPTESVDCDNDGIGDNADTSKFCMPTTLNYQGYLTDNAGTAITATPTITFRLYDADTGGTPYWETNIPVNVTNGVYSVVLGESTAINPTMFSKQLYLGVHIQGEASEMTPRQKLAAVPYAMRAATVEDGGLLYIKSNGVTIGRLISMSDIDASGHILIRNNNGYIFKLILDIPPAMIIGDNAVNIIYTTPDCSGTPYTAAMFPGSVANIPDLGEIRYVEKNAVPENIQINSVRILGSGTCSPISVNRESYPLILNNESVTGVPSGGYSGPITIRTQP